MASLPDILLTEEQYLVLERAAETKSEFHGRMHARADCSWNHCLIATSIGAILGRQIPPGITSPATEGYDRGDKFRNYRTIESLKEYLLIDQERRHVEHYSKQDDGSWLLREYSGPESSVSIPRLNVLISLADLYAGALNPD